MKLALELKAFDAKMRTRVVRSATVVRDSATAFMAKVAFVFAREHKVFYDDVDAAYAWLEGKPVPLSAAPFAESHSRSHPIR